VNSVLQPATSTDAPVVGVALWGAIVLGTMFAVGLLARIERKSQAIARHSARHKL